MPKSLTSVGEGAFVGTALTSINIPSSLKYCAGNAFGYKIRTVNIESLIQWLSMERAPYFSNSDNGIEYYIAGESVENLVIPEEITSIRSYAFNDGRNIKRLFFTKI